MDCERVYGQSKSSFGGTKEYPIPSIPHGYEECK